VTAIELIGTLAMVGALLAEWRTDLTSRTSLALWSIALVALMVVDAWSPLVGLFGINVGARGAIQILGESR
jgi:hypothetical protein